MCQRNPDAPDKYPDNVKNGRQTPRLSRYIPHLPPKRHQGKETYLKTLESEGDTDNSQTKQ